MKCLKLIFLLALAISLLVESTEVKPLYDEDEDFPVSENAETTSLRGGSRFLAQNMRFRSMRCNKHPGICQVKGSPGPDCCKKRCVNVLKDRFNCGKCGHKCKFSEICCEGKCVNLWTDEKHCGGCNNNCKNGGKCMFGMCSYA